MTMKLFLLLTFNILISLKNLNTSFADGNTDMQALLALKSQVSENKRLILASWNQSTPLCEWSGITCGSKHKRVTGLDLGGFNLDGIISPSIGNLSFLRTLNLGDNSFGGTIPNEVGMLFRLERLNMSFNILQGVIPTSLYNCSRLLTLDLTKNHLVGGLPSELGLLSSLENLYLSKNNISGKLPTSLGNLTSLRQLSVAYNQIEGRVPNTIGRLNQLLNLQISVNSLSGVFPQEFYNLSTLQFLSIGGNDFSGNIRSDFGNIFRNLIELQIGLNYFSGELPKTISNITNLRILEVSQNQFTGSIPLTLGMLHNIQLLGLNNNYFGNKLVGDLDFLGSLVNCTNLQILDVGYNTLGGELPISLTNLSNELTATYFGGNSISGGIPNDISNLINLQSLGLENNLLTGEIPTSFGKLSRLKDLLLNSNRMSGEIPSSIGNITQLETLVLFNNSFQGSIPPSLGNCSFLLYLLVGSNRLNGTIPPEIMQLESLVQLHISKNLLTGPFPKDVGRLKLLVVLSAGNNKFYGNIPETLGDCLSMEELYLGGNSFDGSIPDIRNLQGLKNIDLSNNKLCCNIPEYLGNLSSLEYLNLSVNNFEGMVPTLGIFRSFDNFSVSNNGKLCGGIPELKLSPCPINFVSRSHSSNKKKIWIGVGVGIGIALVLSSLLAYVLMKRKNKKKKSGEDANNLMPDYVFHERVSYDDLRAATCDFSLNNLIGSGSFGTVFRGTLVLDESKVVAVKVLNLQRSGATKSFMAECEALKSIKHRNLVKLLTACSSIDSKGNEFKALVYEFMPNGNLDMWLHTQEAGDSEIHYRPLKLFERLNIAIDVASILNYIHSQCHDPVAHCDIKPSNILLDNDLIAHVSDFGLARILDQESFINQISSTGAIGTIGYAAPEYGIGGRPSREGDLYSFGVLVLELFTGKRPTDDLFVRDLTLRSYIESGLSENVLDIVDISIFDGEVKNKKIDISECLKVVFHVGIRCCEESPKNRKTMAEALSELVSLKEKFFKIKMKRVYA